MSIPARTAAPLPSIPSGNLIAGALLISLVAAACGGGEKSKSGETAAAPPAATPPATPGGAPGSSAGPTPGAPPQGATAAMVAEGDSIFHGLKAGGICQTCHGPDATGTALAPSLVANKWLTGDGSFDFIQQRVTTGMPTPTPPYTAPMMPKGGANLSPDQIKSVSAYVYSISRAKTR